MLQLLRVKNLAVVENASVAFDRGLNVITGETGAGKSILAGALNLVLGGRADKTLIRSGEEACGVEATFDLADSSEVDSVLEELGIDTCADGQLIIRRIVSAGGSGKNIVNDCPATVQALKKIGDLLVDMHGPHDHQSLLSQNFQLDLLDAFGHLWKDRAAYEDIYRELLKLSAKLQELQGRDEDVAERIDLLSYQVREIEDAKLSDEDEGDLEQEHRTCANVQRILELANGITSGLTEDDQSAFNTMTVVQGLVNNLGDLVEDGSEWSREAQAIAIQLQELSDSINRRAQAIDGDPGRLQWLEDRMALIQKLKRKYGSSVQEILAELEEKKIKLRDLETRGEQIAEMEKQSARIKAALLTAGTALGGKRRIAAEALSKAITGNLRDLGFQHAEFSVELNEAEPRLSGTDAIEFGFAPNVGETMRPLRLIASSGEISRVMLATKAVLAAHDRIPVLIFDEIDANVGGEIGNAIGTKLSTVAKSHQVVCITHLPQVAVHGNAHFVVTKEVKDGRTHTRIESVSEEARAEEIARMLGGRDLTSVTLAHAREMLTNI